MANPLETMTMIDNNKPRPSVSSSTEAPSQGSGKEENRAEGTKNLWVQTDCHWNTIVCTYSSRSLSSDDGMLEFEDELAKINFDVIGISEVRRKGEGCLSLANSGHNLYYICGNTCYSGVGFLVHKNIAGNVTSFKGVSNRLVQLTVKIKGKYHMNIIQAYLPTISHTGHTGLSL